MSFEGALFPPLEKNFLVAGGFIVVFSDIFTHSR